MLGSVEISGSKESITRVGDALTAAGFEPSCDFAVSQDPSRNDGRIMWFEPGRIGECRYANIHEKSYSVKYKNGELFLHLISEPELVTLTLRVELDYVFFHAVLD